MSYVFRLSHTTLVEVVMISWLSCVGYFYMITKITCSVKVPAAIKLLNLKLTDVFSRTHNRSF